MLASRLAVHRTGCRSVSTAAVQQVLRLPTSDVTSFRERFKAETPVLLPQGTFKDIPAIKKWFKHGRAEINASYLSKFSSTRVPLEFTSDTGFSRMEQSLSFFLECVASSTSTHDPSHVHYFNSHVPGARIVKRKQESNTFFSSTAISTPEVKIYLAQAPITDLPGVLRADLPTPEIVLKAGSGDVYDSSIWMGLAPTYTPLHKDPNPNLFVQLAGSKIVRILRPELGRAIFYKVQEAIGGQASQSFRGDEMMYGAERAALEKEVWQNPQPDMLEASLDSGDALFIPKGWWHSIKGTGTGINGSVNWWFR